MDHYQIANDTGQLSGAHNATNTKNISIQAKQSQGHGRHGANLS